MRGLSLVAKAPCLRRREVNLSHIDICFGHQSKGDFDDKTRVQDPTNPIHGRTFFQMRRTGRPPLRFAGRLHALGHAPQVRVPRAGSRGSGWLGGLPPHAGVRRPGLQPAGQGHYDDRPRRASRAGISEAVRVGDVHLTDAMQRSDVAFIRRTNLRRPFPAKKHLWFSPVSSSAK